ncbi:MAG TPA: WYL domain-containing protein [Spirochaetota bacterium]|nr:WYL domain-containing protein [Spirochaetota bacterium]HRS63056.1 WYL domain-containing protein [Spirochaetota bacterium]HRU66612.1 WYL domain-containing protein [Spirochaetota bacterium]
MSGFFSAIGRQNFNVFMRQLHIIALIQHTTSFENINCSKIADFFESENFSDFLTERQVYHAVEKLKRIGFPVNTNKGSNRIYLTRQLSYEEMLNMLPFYLQLVTDAAGLKDYFKRYINTHGNKSLWLLGRIYFASCEKRRIKIWYRSREKEEATSYTINPYRWLYRDNAIYLMAKNLIRDNISLFKLDRIKDLELTEDFFEEEIPSTDELLSKSVGAFIGHSFHKVELSFAETYEELIFEHFGHMNPDFESLQNGFMKASFEASDIINVCKIVFGFEGKVKITGDAVVVEEMKNLLRKNFGNYL